MGWGVANRFSKFIEQLSKHFIAAAVLFLVLMLILPFPAVLLDFMMIVNLSISIVILLTVVYTPKSSDLTSFPRIILISTSFALALNVRSTFYILMNGHVGLARFDAEMIKSFAQIVAGGNIVIGFVVFIILIIIQTLVFSKGTTRISEVQARFALDSMNMKLLSVDSELNSGFITEEQAKEKKASIQRDLNFYSAMDGATKFVSGNVKAGIVITVVNLVAGIVISMLQFHMTWSDAIQTFPMLTIGDGLLSQLPSLLLSVATGILVAGSNSSETIDASIKREFTVSGYVYVICGGALAFIGLLFFIIGGSAVLFALLLVFGGILFAFGYRLIKNEKLSFAKKVQAEADAKSNRQTGSSPEEISPVMPPDPLSLELGIALVELVDKQKGAELLERVTKIRREAALDMGLVVPRIRIIDNLSLDPQEYCFKIHGIEVGKGRLKLGYFMCIDTGTVVEPVNGEQTVDPAFGVPAIWVSEEQRMEAERAGYSVIDPPTIIATHMTELIRSHAAEILGRQEVSAIVKKIKETNPVVVEEVIDTYKYTYGEIEKILQGLLRERVSIRNIVAILETLANFGMWTPHNIDFLIEKVREDLGLQICLQYVDSEDKKLSVLRLSQSWCEKILEHKAEPGNGAPPYLAFDPVDGRKWISSVSSGITAVREKNFLPIILCPTEVRRIVHDSIENELPGTIVLSYNEVIAAGKNINLEVLGEISE